MASVNAGHVVTSGSVLVEEDVLAEGPGWQDYLGRHTVLDGVVRRVRFYLVDRAASKEARATTGGSSRPGGQNRSSTAWDSRVSLYQLINGRAQTPVCPLCRPWPCSTHARLLRLLHMEAGT